MEFLPANPPTWLTCCAIVLLLREIVLMIRYRYTTRIQDYRHDG